jgi:hypothetical protein
MKLEIELTIRNAPSHEVPAWAQELGKGILELGTMMALLAKKEDNLMTTADDITVAVQGLVDNSAKVDAAIDQLVAAQGDQTKLSAAVTALQNLKSDQDTHLANLVTAQPPGTITPPDGSGSTGTTDGTSAGQTSGS